MIHQASKQPPLQEAVQALPSPTSWGGGHSHIKFAIVLMESNSNPTREKDALGIHQASKQPPLQEAVQALPSPTSSAGGHSHTHFATALMDSISISTTNTLGSTWHPRSLNFSIVLMPADTSCWRGDILFGSATINTYHHNV